MYPNTRGIQANNINIIRSKYVSVPIESSHKLEPILSCLDSRLFCIFDVTSLKELDIFLDLQVLQDIVFL
jgi:hypothetical protein